MALSACGMKSPAKTPILKPDRVPNETVTFHQCMEDRACLDKPNFKKLIKNMINTEAYIRQIENLLNGVTEPIK
jgi:hypothetical protein